MVRWLVRWARRIAMVMGGILIVLVVLAWLSTEHFLAFGGDPSGRTLARMKATGRFQDGELVNTELTGVMKSGEMWGSLVEWATGDEMRAPICPLPIARDTRARLAAPATSGLRVTWLGHSTTLIEIDGATLLTDPVWSERASPSSWVGPSRFHPPPLAFRDLPHVDAVLISHEHYDHLDMATIRDLARRGVEFHVPLGIGAHLTAWGVRPTKIVEHDWWEAKTLPGGVRIVSLPARHFNGRGIPWRTGALWTSWALTGPRHRIYFSGDTGLQAVLPEIARREGPFDLSIQEIGQFHSSWSEIHLGPAGALEAHDRLGARTLLPIHWGTFQLGYHAWSEPAETLVRLARERGISVVTPRPGEPVEPTLPSRTTAWWRTLPPTTARCP
jgi:L-ascorbate metabolism protein UlaG (beta-lactamase superfamily)